MIHLLLRRRLCAAPLVLLPALLSPVPATAGSLGGAADGFYREAGGDGILVDSAQDLVGVTGLDCFRPRVAEGRLRAQGCWGNGHRVGGVDVGWQVVDGDILSEGRRYVRQAEPRPVALSGAPAETAPASPPVATVPPSAAAPTGQAAALDGDLWLHNGSTVLVDTRLGEIRYEEPKAGIRKAVQPGTVLFRGTFARDGRVSGIAYAFKAGCAPAPYAVSGTYPLKPSFVSPPMVLRGPSPKRDPHSCAVIGYSDTSPNARLVFDVNGDV